MSQYTFVNENNPLIRKPADIFAVTLTWTGAASISSATSTVYVDGSEDPDTILSGSNSSSGVTQTSKTITIPATYGGKQIVLEFEAVVDGYTLHEWVDIRISDLPR